MLPAMDENRERDTGVLAPSQRDVLLREGRAVLRSLGARRLAGEFSRRAALAPSRDALADLLLEYILMCRAR
jgi:hypothetical protein